MANPFFERPILNSPYQCPQRHWELDEHGQPTQKIKDSRRPAEFITPIPKPKKRRAATATQQTMVLDEGAGLSTKEQEYDATSFINEVRRIVGEWRALPNSSQWQVTPETARLLQHWRHHDFPGIRPFFCQVEAVGDPLFPARLGVRRGDALPLDRQRLLADGRHRMRHRQAASSPGGRQYSRQRYAHVPQPVGTHPLEDAQEGAR